MKKPICPVCQKEMQRKGHKGPNCYYKCKQCKGMLRNGYFSEHPSKEQLEQFNRQVKLSRQVVQKMQMIKELKKQKTSLKQFTWNGEFINLEDYDSEGRKITDEKVLAENAKKKLMEGI